jgi:putative MATE family efflux protein
MIGGIAGRRDCRSAELILESAWRWVGPCRKQSGFPARETVGMDTQDQQNGGAPPTDGGAAGPGDQAGRSDVTPTSAPSAPPTAPTERFWALVREAVAGSHRDFTQESLGRAILLLAVPMVLEMIMESVFAVVDIFWVSRLGSDAVATVGLTETMLTIVYSLAMGLSMGATAVVARRTGEKDREGAARAGVQAIAMGVLLAAVVGVLGAIFAPQLLALMGASQAVLTVGSGYTRVMLGGSVTILLLFLINAVFRGAGDAALAMRTLWLANGINIVLAPFLVFGWGPFPQLGVTGAAVATTIGRGTGVVYAFVTLVRGRGRLVVSRRHLRLDLEAALTILRVARSGVVQILIGTASWVGLVRVLSGFGSAALAGYTIAIRVVLFALLPSWGMANAAATLVGQNLGAGRPDRAEQAVWRAAFYNLIFLGSVGLLFILLGEAIVGLFTSDPVVAGYGSNCLRIVAAGFFLYAYGMVVGAAFNGAGDTRTPTLINLFCFWALEIPLAFALAHPLGMGPTGVFIAITVAFSAVAVVSVRQFRRGRWKTIKV